MSENNKYINLKDGESVTFQPLERKGKMKAQVWDNDEKTYINEGENINGKEVDRYLKLTDDEKKRYSKKITYLRSVVVDGDSKYIDMSQTANRELEKVMKVLEKVEHNPLEYEYTLKRNKSKNGFTYYTVNLQEHVGKTGIDQSHIDKPEGFELTEKQKKVIQKYKKTMKKKGYDPEKKEVKETFLKGLREYDFPVNKLEKIYEIYFVK